MRRVDESTPGGGWMCPSVTGKFGVTTQTFVEIEGKSKKVFSLFLCNPFYLLLGGGSGENEDG